MSRSRLLGPALAALLLAAVPAAAVVLPPDGFAPGWTRAGKPQVYRETDLFNSIDGGAELFLEFGFTQLTVQFYAREFFELALEVYEMESPESALGVYLLKAGKEAPVKGIDARNTGDRYQITLVRDKWFVHVNNADGLPGAVPAMSILAEKLLASIPKGKPVTLFDTLPREGLIPGSERIFRGPYALQSLYTFGPGDILLQKGRIFGVAGDYRGPEGGTVTRIFVTYPDISAAEAAFDHLRQNLDSYLVVVEKYAQGFVFHDFQDKYGQVLLRGRGLEIRVNLPTKPVI
jgi:hypothetical protein